MKTGILIQVQTLCDKTRLMMLMMVLLSLRATTGAMTRTWWPSSVLQTTATAVETRRPSWNWTTPSNTLCKFMFPTPSASSSLLFTPVQFTWRSSSILPIMLCVLGWLDSETFSGWSAAQRKRCECEDSERSIRYSLLSRRSSRCGDDDVSIM